MLQPPAMLVESAGALSAAAAAAAALLLHLPQPWPTTRLMVADLKSDPGMGILPFADVILIIIWVPGAAAGFMVQVQRYRLSESKTMITCC